MEEINNIKARYELIKDHLDERSKRLFCATEAKVLGHGGIKTVHLATNVSPNTISNGLKELEEEPMSKKGVRVRKDGGGRKKVVDQNPEIEKKLLELVEPTVRGEPQSALLWTTKSLRNLSKQLKVMGYNVSHVVVGDILKANNFSLQANSKTDEGKSHIDRDKHLTI